MSEGAKRTMCRGMAIATNNGQARHGKTFFRTSDMHNTLTQIHHTNMVNAEFSTVFFKCLNLNTALLVFNGFNTSGAVSCRNVMVSDSKRFRWHANLTTGHSQPFKSLRAGDLMNEVPINVKKAIAVVLFIDKMRLPDFIIERRMRHEFTSPKQP